ncbi:hypothetical protein BGZ57DRAFT_878642 [Hyaloscypha finlandica]|nr:hypothetical protein BGZ57DRAFT_878642 [Hyaloscypha finlandica]
MHLNRSTPARFALFSLLSFGSSLPFHFLEPLDRRATYSVVPVDGGSAAPTEGSGQGDATIYRTIIVTATPAPATKTIIETDTAENIDYIISTQTVQLSGTVRTILVTITPPAATITKTGYSIIDVSASQVTSTTTPSPSSSSTIPTTSASLETSSSSIKTFQSSSTSSHSFDDGQWHTYYPARNASSTSITPQAATTTSVEATPTPTPDVIVPPVEPGGGYGGLGSRQASPRVVPEYGSFGFIGTWERKLRRGLANLL